MIHLRDIKAVNPPKFFRETDNVSADPDRLRYVCEHCGEVQEPIQCSLGYFVRRQCYCREQAAIHMPITASELEAQRARHDTHCYTWLAPHDDSDLVAFSFDSYNPALQPENRQDFVQALSATRQYARQFITSWTRQRMALDNLLMSGGYGVGKTHLASAILNALRQVNIPCRFCAAPDLFTALYAANFGDKQHLLSEASSTPLLVLDDLDKVHTRAETDGAYQKKTLFEVLNGRYRKHLPTIITTNAGALSQWLDGATISRLSERLTTLDMRGRDMRIRR